MTEYKAIVPPAPEELLQVWDSDGDEWQRYRNTDSEWQCVSTGVWMSWNEIVAQYGPLKDRISE